MKKALISLILLTIFFSGCSKNGVYASESTENIDTAIPELETEVQTIEANKISPVAETESTIFENIEPTNTEELTNNSEKNETESVLREDSSTNVTPPEKQPTTTTAAPLETTIEDSADENDQSEII